MIYLYIYIYVGVNCCITSLALESGGLSGVVENSEKDTKRECGCMLRDPIQTDSWARNSLSTIVRPDLKMSLSTTTSRDQFEGYATHLPLKTLCG